MVDPDVKDWERLRREIPAVENKIDNAMAECHKDDWSEEDVVNQPSHYNSGGIECIEAIEQSMNEEAFKGYLKGNCMKYLWRYETKHPDRPAEDLKKARWYLNKLIEVQDAED